MYQQHTCSLLHSSTTLHHRQQVWCCQWEHNSGNILQMVFLLSPLLTTPLNQCQRSTLHWCIQSLCHHQTSRMNRPNASENVPFVEKANPSLRWEQLPAISFALHIHTHVHTIHPQISSHVMMRNDEDGFCSNMMHTEIESPHVAQEVLICI
jgi:hypothetical protein